MAKRDSIGINRFLDQLDRRTRRRNAGVQFNQYVTTGNPNLIADTHLGANQNNGINGDCFTVFTVAVPTRIRWCVAWACKVSSTNVQTNFGGALYTLAEASSDYPLNNDVTESRWNLYRRAKQFTETMVGLAGGVYSVSDIAFDFERDVILYPSEVYAMATRQDVSTVGYLPVDGFDMSAALSTTQMAKAFSGVFPDTVANNINTPDSFTYRNFTGVTSQALNRTVALAFYSNKLMRALP